MGVPRVVVLTGPIAAARPSLRHGHRRVGGSRRARLRELARALADPGRVLSRQPDAHLAAHARFRALLPHIPRDLLLDTSSASVEELAGCIEQALDL